MTSVRVTDATTDDRTRSIRISSAAYSHLAEVARQLDTGISFTANLLIAEGTVRTVGATADGDSRSIWISPAAYHHLVGISRKLSLSISRAAHLLIISGTKETIEDALLARAHRHAAIGPGRAAETATRLDPHERRLVPAAVLMPPLVHPTVPAVKAIHGKCSWPTEERCGEVSVRSPRESVLGVPAGVRRLVARRCGPSR